MAAEQQQQKPILPEEFLKVIHGQVPHEDKKQQYQESLQNWWKDYSHRKNDEEDMVADSLLYDERCHLPRTTAGPRPQPEPEVAAAAAAAAVAAAEAVGQVATGAAAAKDAASKAASGAAS